MLDLSPINRTLSVIEPLYSGPEKLLDQPTWGKIKSPETIPKSKLLDCQTKSTDSDDSYTLKY